MSGTPARLYTTTEAADALRVSYDWLKKQVSAGKVRHVRMGRAVRFSEADIASIIEAREQPVVRKPGGQRSRL